MFNYQGVTWDIPWRNGMSLHFSGAELHIEILRPRLWFRMIGFSLESPMTANDRLVDSSILGTTRDSRSPGGLGDPPASYCGVIFPLRFPMPLIRKKSSSEGVGFRKC